MKKPEPSVDAEIAKRVRDDLGDACMNDWLEVAIVITMLTAIGAGAYLMYLIYELNQVSA